ncbi:hypothetical protein G4B84_007707 [Aspergillus flavus NRRL3357]|nr:uncharacterized protein G4B84_007707 [Aspergillus flavus NRRL3357]QMW32276.1 hypothetical protein G4B84_007707 [Aspergillus flavus NRRL3357]QMW44303.1 hypothetical protein G4B11_007723 [Aspergillus flavus]
MAAIAPITGVTEKLTEIPQMLRRNLVLDLSTAFETSPGLPEPRIRMQLPPAMRNSFRNHHVENTDTNVYISRFWYYLRLPLVVRYVSSFSTKSILKRIPKLTKRKKATTSPASAPVTTTTSVWSRSALLPRSKSSNHDPCMNLARLDLSRITR